MKFVVKRTSTYLQNTKPCEEASPIILTRKIRGTKQGTIIKRESAWLIVLSDLQGLLDFVEKYKPVIIDETNFEELDFEIEINDDFD